MANDTLQLHNTQAEIDVLSACVSDENIYASVRHLLHDDMFVDAEARRMFSVFQKLEKEGKTPNLAEAGMMLMSDGGNIADFMQMTIFSFSTTRQRIDTLNALAAKRRLYALCAKGMSLATDPSAGLEDYQKILSELTDTASSNEGSIQSIKDTLESLGNDVTNRKNGKEDSGIMTGLHIFDVRYGLHTGDLVIVAGRTSQGKSSLATTLARNIAADRIPVVFYSLEMGSKQLAARIMSRDMEVPSSRILYDRLSDKEYSKFGATSEAISELPIYFDEKSKTSFEKMCVSIRAMVRKHGVKVVFVDYLQILVNSAQNNNREALLGDITREFKRIAVECNVCMVVLSQLSRSQDTNEPSLSNLRGSGQIEEAADMVVFVYRPEVYGIERWSDGKSTIGTAQITIAKGRNIGLSKEIVQFNGDLTCFSDYLGHEEIAPKQENPWDNPTESNLPF